MSQENDNKDNNDVLKKEVMKKLTDAKRITATFLKRVENS